jgi:4'-phosphopantetheinyl transferase
VLREGANELNGEWLIPDKFPSLDLGEIHVWAVSLELATDQLRTRQQWLAADERQRANRFVFDKHRNRFTAGRGQVREILSHYTGVEPGQLEFSYANLGKPSLKAPPPGMEDLTFNFSNSSTLGLLSVARGVELGVDVERLRDVRNLIGLAERFFDEAEVGDLKSCGGQLQQQVFFRCWTCKEAYLKAVGKGLSFPLNKVLVATNSSQPHYLSIDGDEEESAAWSLTSLRPAPGYIGALTCRRLGDQVRTFRWID